MTTAALLLAAGGGSRFRGGSHKLLAPLRGRPVVAHALAAVDAAGFDEVIVVLGAVDLAASGLLPPAVTVVRNEHWSQGQATSLQAGIAAARRSGHDAVVVGLADQPFVTTEAWRAVAASSGPVAVATYGGRRRNPVKLAAEVWDMIASTGDEGARSLMRARPDLVAEVPVAGDPGDIDTVEDLRTWN
ncbi:MAG: nucleotidyltransferase family protein [Acidimicrobiia bacterium]|nr:nucleotidyltransferase family protein [Acidimicrobiia bacterium]